MRPPIQENATKMKLKLIINKETKQLVFAEADKDFVDFLFTIPQLPLGNLLSLLHESDGDHPLVSKGSLGNLYNTIKYFDERYIVTDMPSICCVPKRSLPVEDVKKTLLKPMTVDTVKINGFHTNVQTTKYIVMDDLTVKPMSVISSINCLEKLGLCVSDVNRLLEEKHVVVGKHEVVRLLKESLMTKTVLTNVFLANGESSVSVDSNGNNHEDYVVFDQVPTFMYTHNQFSFPPTTVSDSFRFGTSTSSGGHTSSQLFGSTTPFGAPTSAPVGGQAQLPAFGSGTPAFGSSSTPAFGSSSTTAFGSRTPAFGSSSTTGFGYRTPAFGSTPF